jgi:hypothetical protein
VVKKPSKIDPADGLVVSEVGDWAEDKHIRVARYIELAGVVRKDYLPPPSSRAGATYIELFSGPGRSLIRGTSRIIDGSPLVAFRAAQGSGVPFTKMHLDDAEAVLSAVLDQRVHALGANAVCSSDPAAIAVDKTNRRAQSWRTPFRLFGSF